MEDRRAFRNFKRNTPTLIQDRSHSRQGRPQGGGRLKELGVSVEGRPVQYYPIKKKEPAKKHCAGIDGPCKAWPVKGDPNGLCAGHRRQFDKARAERADTDDDSSGVE